MTVAFDTLRYARRLREAGLPEAQADAHAEALAGLVGEDLVTKQDITGLATKADLARFATKDDLARFATKDDLARFATKDDLARFATKDDLARCATKDDLARCATKDDLGRYPTKEDLARELALLRAEMREMEQRIIVRVGSMIAASVGITAALVKLL